MESIHTTPGEDSHGQMMAETQRLLDEMERLEMRARLLLAEHRHVLATIADLQHQLEATVSAATALKRP